MTTPRFSTPPGRRGTSPDPRGSESTRQRPGVDPRDDAAPDPHGIATLTVPGTKSPNIIIAAAMDAAIAALARLAVEPGLRVLIVRGPGENCFVGGADIHEMSTLTPASAPAYITRLKNLCEALRSFPVPVVARLSGWCLGAGLELAMACDLRLADSQARFGMPEVKVGIPSVIHAALMPRLIGQARATWMLLTGEPIDAATALGWGLVHSVCAAAELDAAVDASARQLAALAPAVLRQQKRLLRCWEQMPVDQAIAASVAEFADAFSTGEPRREMAAFVRRRR